ncbi:MAG: complex I subunit 1 family protein [Candidatus Omnitrophota bacterium]
MALFYLFIFPGFLFTALAGMLASWVDRKVTARLQWRVGPPWYQPFADFVKLLGKETIVPQQNQAQFLLAPFLGLSAATVVAAMSGVAMLNPRSGFPGDLIVILYFLTIPALSLILGASASANPLASVGASREMKLVLGYELPFVLSILVPIIKSGGHLRLGEILNYQAAHGSFWFFPSGILAFFAAILCMQAKLGYVPFDIAEAEQEIVAGAYVEYSGFPLAVFKLTRQMLLVSLPVLLITLFWGHYLKPGWIILKYVFLLVIIILIKNTNPRLRIDQAVRLFWGPVTLLAALAVVLALLGN